MSQNLMEKVQEMAEKQRAEAETSASNAMYVPYRPYVSPGGVCPNCGHCPSCGRPYGMQPYYGPSIWCGSNITANAGAGGSCC